MTYTEIHIEARKVINDVLKWFPHLAAALSKELDAHTFPRNIRICARMLEGATLVAYDTYHIKAQDLGNLSVRMRKLSTENLS